MATCPKCNNEVEKQAAKCTHCGTPLNRPADSLGTLSPDKLFDLEKDAPPSANMVDPPAAKGKGSVGTLNPDNLFTGAGSSTDGKTIESAAFAPDQSAGNAHDSYAATIVSHDMLSAAALSSNEARTMQYSNDDLRAFGSSGTGTTGRLNRVWEAAIGSSGKGSKQSLRFAREEASDSVFRRVARRFVADANSTSSEQADYNVKNKLGEGGMGIVFSAVQTAVNRTVALKTLRKLSDADVARSRDPKAQEDSRRKQFFYEAEITAELDHPNIPPIYELGVAEDDVLFFTMKLIQGTEWEEVIGKKSREENLEILGKMLDAVAFAHSKNIINRDLKPGNVMLGHYGEAYVTDWGLAVNLSEGKQPGFGGTPDYMAPEMAMYPELAADRGVKVSKASDIYLIGAILFQILHGTPPHAGKDQRARLRAALENEIAETTCDDPLMAIALRALETRPEDRFESVEEMQEAIREVLQHAESISLSQRSEELTEQAIKLKDYDRFTRAIFGFRDALELWKGNRDAESGLHKSRLAYGQCAYEKGDYDLALQTLDRGVPAEAALFDKATSAKLAVQQREQRFRRLRRSFVAALIAFLAVSLSLAGIAWTQKNNAEEARDVAQVEKQKADDAKVVAVNAQGEAEKAQKKAEASAESEKAAKLSEQEQKLAAQKAQVAAERAQKEAEMSAAAEKLAKENEAIEKQNALDAAEAEKTAKLEAQQNAAKIQIDDARSKLSLARAQLDQFDIRGASLSLADVLNIGASGVANLFAGKAPNFDSWAARRVKLLSNADLPIRPLQSPVAAISFAFGQNLGVAGTTDGKLHLLRHQNGQLSIDRTHNFGEASQTKIHAVAVSPSGKEAAIAADVGGKGNLYIWSITEAQPVQIPFTENRSFRGLAFSPDGGRLLAGINGGIWLFPSGSDKWYDKLSQDSVERLEKSQGILSKLQWIDNNTALAAAVFNGKTNLYRLEFTVSKKATSQLIEFPPAIAAEDVTAVAHVPGSNRLLLGRNDGSMWAADVGNATTDGARRALSNVVELPKKHRAAVSQIIVNSNGSVLSMSDEPVSHLWQADKTGQLTYDMFLSGVPGSTKESTATVNLAQAAYIGPDAIVGVDGQGVAFSWNVQRQKQRRQLTRLSDNGSESYASSVIGVFSRSKHQQALAVTSDGAVDLWDLRTGKTIPIDSTPQNPTVARWSYFGHTPGAEFVDSVVDPKAGIVVTSASLRNAQKKYLNNPEHTREFCVWDQTTGNMLRRWTEATDETLAPRLSLLSGGKDLLIAGERETRIVSTHGHEVFSNTSVGAYFAVPHPRQPNLLAMVKRSGLTWLWDRPSTRLESSLPERFVSEIKNGYPQKGVWTQDGQRFYTVYTRGDVAVYELKDSKLEFVWSSNRLASDPLHKELWEATSGAEYPTNSHYDMDVAVATSGPTDRLYINLRDALTKVTRQTVLDFGRAASIPKLVTAKRVSEVAWLDEGANGVPTFTNTVHTKFSLSKSSADRVLARQRVGQLVFVSTNSARVLKLAEAPLKLTSLGRQTLLSASADRAGNTLLTLHGDGSVWRLDIADDHRGTWRRMAYSLPSARQIQISPDGKQLLVHSTSGDSIRRIDVATGNKIDEFSGAVAAAWDPTENSVPAIGFSVGGKIAVVGADGTIHNKAIDLKAGAVIKSLHFFNEIWSDPKVPASRYLAIHTEGASSGSMNFIPLEANGAAKLDLMEIKKDSLVACSPTDSTIVIGDSSGTISVWFASPFWERAGQVFDLEGHRGARIESLVFSGNGETLVTSDSNRRLFGWLSRDASSN